MQITGIILSGGRSIRMGTDKALLRLNGKTLLENAIGICKPLCSNIIISSGNPEHSKYGYQAVADEIAGCGPLGGIYSCLKKSETEWNFILSVDAVYVEPGYIKHLFSQISVNFDAVVPVHDLGKEPLIAVYNKVCVGIMSEKLESGDYKMQNVLNAVNTKYIDSQHWIEAFPKIFCNLNRPEDFQAKPEKP